MGKSSNKRLRLSWHPAFIEALQMELLAYQDALEFHPEYQLTAEPLRIDCVVIKKAKGAVIRKNIAAIFREWNILEHKRPGDFVSVTDYYKVYGYACLYASLKRAPVTGLTLSFIESRYPRKLLDYLKNERGFTIAETGAGIYTVSGDVLAVQVIDSSRLPAEENLWLKNLTDKLDYPAFSRLSREINPQGKGARIGPHLQVIAQANPGIKKKKKKMDDTLTIEKVFENVGWIAKWEARGEAKGEARGEERKALAIARNMVNLGFPAETVVSATQLDPEKVKTLYQQA
jgi:hypothetical protein